MYGKSSPQHSIEDTVKTPYDNCNAPHRERCVVHHKVRFTIHQSVFTVYLSTKTNMSIWKFVSNC